MRKLVLIALLGVSVLAGCASTTPGSAASANSPAAASAPAALVQQPVTIPVASAKKVVLVMTGSKEVVEATDWGAFKETWRASFAKYAKESNTEFSMQELSPPPSGAPGTVVAVYVNDYRLVGFAARRFLGVMSGNAYIDAKVSYRDLKTGQTFGVQEYNTTSRAWEGVFGKYTLQQVDEIGKQIFIELKPKP